jgi:hypothetical protein
MPRHFVTRRGSAAPGLAQVSELRGVRRVVVVQRRGGRRRLTRRFPASFATLTSLKHGAVAFRAGEEKAEVEAHRIKCACGRRRAGNL